MRSPWRQRFTVMLGLVALAALSLQSCGDGTATAPPKHTAQVATLAPATPTAAPIADRLFVRDGYGSSRALLRVVGGAAPLPEAMPLGAISPDWSLMYTARHYTSNGGNATILRVLDLHTGAVVRETTLVGLYELPSVGIGEAPGGLSPDGRWLTLQGSGNDRQRSSLAVLDTAFAHPLRTLELDGRFEFDALANNGAALYLTEYPVPSAEDRYQVRRYDLTAGVLDPTPVAIKGEGTQMSGIRRMALPSGDGNWLYSLYVNDGHAFIHALNLPNGFAICLDLEGQGDFDQQVLWSLAMGGDGTLYAANGALGEVATVVLREDIPQLTRSVKLPTAPEASLSEQVASWLVPVAAAKRVVVGGAALSPDGRTLFALAERGLLAIDTKTLSLRARLAADTPLDSVALSADGARLYAVSAERGVILQLDPSNGATLSEVKGASQPWGVLHVTE